jgi:hypothetical protein
VPGKRRALLAPLLGVGLLVAGWAAGPAAGQEAGRLVLRGVDASDPNGVQLIAGWSGDPDELGHLQLDHDGKPVEVHLGNLADAGLRNDIAIVVDTSSTTAPNGLLTEAKGALDDLVDALPNGVRAAVVSAGVTSQTMQGLTDDRAKLHRAIDELTPAGDGAVFAGVRRGAHLVGTDGAIPTVLLVTDGVENPTTGVEQARSAIEETGAALFVVGLQDGKLDEGTFGGLADNSGGRLVQAGSATVVDDLVGQVQPELVQLTTVTFASGSDRGVHDLGVQIGDTRVDGSYIAGGTLVGAQRLEPRPADKPHGIAFFRSETGWILGLGLTVLAGGLFAYGIASLFVKEDRLKAALLPYADGYTRGGDDDDESGGQALAQTALLQRAVAITEHFAQRQGFLSRLEKSLEKADLPLRAGEALFFYGAAIVVLAVGGAALSGNLMGGLLLGVIVAIVPPGVVNFLARR